MNYRVLDAVLTLCGAGLGLLLVLRGVLTGWWRAYPFAFVYFVAVEADTVLGFLIYRWWLPWYIFVYWWGEALTAVLGFGVIWQVYREIPSQYAGLARVIKTTAQWFTASAPMFLFIGFLLSPDWIRHWAGMERSVRCFQAALIGIIIIIVFSYRIPVSRNLHGLMLGYGWFIAISILGLTLWPAIGAGWRRIIPVGFLLGQAIWLASFWDSRPLPAAESVPDVSDEGPPAAPALARLRYQLWRPFL